MPLPREHLSAQLPASQPSISLKCSHTCISARAPAQACSQSVYLGRLFWIGLLHRPQACTDVLIRCAHFIYCDFTCSLPPLFTFVFLHEFRCVCTLMSALLVLLYLLPWSLFSFLSSFSFHSLSPIISPLLGISGSISFKAHVKGTVCHFQRPLCPAFLSLNLVSPKHFPIAWLSRPLFSQLPLAFHSLLSPGSSSCPTYILPKMIYISHGYFFCNLTVFVLFLKHAH